MTAAWLRDPGTGNLWQVAGNLASYSGTDTEDEGASNFVGTGTAISAYRTSGFKDWWVINPSNTGSNAQVNAVYTVAPAAGGTGWTFTSGGVSKTIRLTAAGAGRLDATYQLSGLNKAFVRFGLSPDLLKLMLHGQAGLADEINSDNRVELTHGTGSDAVRAFVEAPQINPAASDIAGSTFTTVLRRNQVQTHQVEVELTGAGPHSVSLGFDLPNVSADADNDGLPDDWENLYGLSTGDNGSVDANNGPGGDPDEDTISNYIEWLTGLNPTLDDRDSYPKLKADRQSDGSVRLEFPVIPDRRYRIHYGDDLVNWTPLPPDTDTRGMNADPAFERFDPAPAANQSKRFYRLEIGLPEP
jgi:hypothetical protein